MNDDRMKCDEWKMTTILNKSKNVNDMITTDVKCG